MKTVWTDRSRGGGGSVKTVWTDKSIVCNYELCLTPQRSMEFQEPYQTVGSIPSGKGVITRPSWLIPSGRLNGPKAGRSGNLETRISCGSTTATTKEGGEMLTVSNIEQRTERIKPSCVNVSPISTGLTCVSSILRESTIWSLDSTRICLISRTESALYAIRSTSRLLRSACI